MNKDIIIAQLKDIIEDVSQGKVKAVDIRPDTKIIKELGLDSLDYATVMLSCESALQCKILEQNIAWHKVITVEDLADIFIKFSKPV